MVNIVNIPHNSPLTIHESSVEFLQYKSATQQAIYRITKAGSKKL